MSTPEQFLEKPLPSSPDSERVILGAILLDNTLISQAIELLKEDYFYIPLHRRVFKAMSALFERGEKIDPILIGEELKKEGQYESSGGIATITNLTFGLPHFSNIESYAKVVKGKAITRNLIKVCNQITSEALAEEDDAEVILDHAEQAIFALADERSRQGFSHVKPIAENVLHKVQEFAKRESHALTGLATGYRDLDSMTSGLQRTDLIIVAARPSMGKTALCLNIAQNAAILEGAVVAVFSLEMSKEQLVMRMLSSEARVDAHRFRNGFLTRDEWGRLAEAIGTLSEAKIFIDDTPGISPLEMRAKVRRLVAEQKQLDLIVVDYMQLMSGSGKRNDNRQQEVSQISRELKGLAKEMNVPLIALSQLSRAPEARNPPKPQMSDLRESGCLTGDSLVTMADTGERVPIRELVGKTGFRVWALNQHNWNLEKAIVTNSFSTGIKPVYRLKTKLGHEIRATGNHKFLSLDGWKHLDQFRTGEKLATARNIPSDYHQTMSNDELALLAHLIGDGCTLPRHSIQYTTREEDLAELVAKIALRVFPNDIKPKIKQERTWFQVYLTSTRHHTHNVRSAIAEWLDDLNVWGLRSHEKFVPEKVFQQPKEAIALFLRHLWATDGCIWVNKNSNHHPGIYYATSSKRLAEDVKTLFLRVSINARIRQIPQKKGKDQYHVIVSGKQDIEIFINEIKAIGLRRIESLMKVKKFIDSTKANSNRDSIPKDVWQKIILPEMREKGISSRQLAQRIGMKYCRTTLYKQNLSRERALRIAEAIDSNELRFLAKSDVYWDEIVSIELNGEEEVFDLTVENLANFESKGFMAHNSIEQDADLVAFIYRDEYYKPSEENQGIAELLISKQRNGPTGAVKLAFLKEFTRFENYFGGE